MANRLLVTSHLLVGIVCLVLAPTRAHANTITTFNLAGTFADGSILSGNVTIDVTAGVIQSISASTTGTSPTGPYSGLPSITGTGIGVSGAAWLGPSLNQLQVVFDTGNAPSLGTLVGYAGGSLCSTANTLCGGQGESFIYLSNSNTDVLLASGSATPTPEPATLGLLVTGLAGMFLTRARRKHLS